jgi:nitrous oxide reductase
MSNLSDKDRLNLKEMVKSYGADDNTTKIRDLKHSRQIRDSVETLLKLKRKHSRMQQTNKAMFEKLIISKCNFLWNNYTNIFNRLLKDEINVNILYKFIDKLREIEEGVTDQHTASVEVGKILKEMYIDSALRKEKKYEAENNSKKPKERKAVKNISWAKFKTAGLGQ